MKKIIFCICLLISLLLTTQVVTFAQSEEKNIKDTYVGEWHDTPRTEENYSKAYFFEEDGTFVYQNNAPKKDNENLLFSEGIWEIENNMLVLTVNGKILKNEQGEIYYSYPKKKEILQYKIIESEKEDDYATCYINGTKYWYCTSYINLFTEPEYYINSFVGMWHADTCYTDTDNITKLFRKRYLFKEDGTFVYGTNTKKREGNGDLLYLDGTWAIQNHLLTLETTGKVIEENGENKYIKLESPQITQYNITVPKETDELLNIDSTAKTTINGLQYWKFPEGSRGDDMFEDYKRLTSALNAENFCGNWNQTYVYLQTNTLIGKPISLIITDQKDGKFKFKFEAPQIVGIYRLEGEAIINSNHTAYFINKQNGDEYTELMFTKEKDYIDIDMTYSDQYIYVPYDDRNWAENHEIRGRYIQGTPEYIDYKSEIFEDKKVEQKVKNLIGEKAFEQMIFIMDRSYDHWIWRPEQKKTTYTGILEEKDIKVELLITDKYIYCLGYNLEKENWVLYTNDKNYKNSVPKFFELYDNATIEYVYKEI